MLEYDQIETPENVELQRRLAGIGTRFIAGFIDNLIIVGIFLLLGIVVAIIGAFGVFDPSSLVGKILIVFGIIFAFLLYWGYFLLFELIGNGRTPGKKYIKIRVVKSEGQGVDFSSIAIRNFLRVVDSIGGYAVAGLFMFITKRMQRLGDLAAGTVVISEQTTNYAAEYDKKKNVTDDIEISSGDLDSSGLNPKEFTLLRNYWIRREELDLDARKRVLPRLVTPPMNRIGKSVEGLTFEELEDIVGEIVSSSSSKTSQNNNLGRKDES